MTGPRIAVLIPCYNEAAAIGGVVAAFRAALPTAAIHVYDNNSRDDTIARALEAGAIVGREPHQGKGHVVRRMFADIDADIFVLVDGDGTYDAADAPKMIAKLRSERLDMVNAQRIDSVEASYRPGHRFGNRFLTEMVRIIFGDGLQDLLSGYRVFSRRYVKSFPALAEGFEIETELSVHALALGMPIAEIPSQYSIRSAGTESKLRTYRDGWRIFWTIFWLAKIERPLVVFGFGFIFFGSLSILLGIPIFIIYAETGLVPRLPSAVAATGAGILAFLSTAVGLILDSVTRARLELRRLHYLGIAPPE